MQPSGGVFRHGFLIVIPGRCEASNPECAIPESGPSDHPGMTLPNVTPLRALARPERAVLAHHLDQHAFAQAPVGDAQTRQREGFADRVENGAAGQHQIGALDADAIIVGAFLVAHVAQALDDGGDVGIVHPDAVDPPAIVARQIEMDPGKRRHRA